jgi:signal transduction histidine kinase
MPIGFRTKRQARAPRPGGVRKTALLFLVFCLGLTVGLSAPRAQTTPTIQAPTPQPTALEVSLVQDNGTLKLSDVIPINLVPYISYYADPDGQLTPQSTLSRYIRRERAFSPFYDIFRPSAPSPMHWAIINIYNQTDLGEWTLDFGDRLTGRNSYFTGLKIVDVLTNKTILDQSITENPYGVRNERDLQLRSSISIPLRPKAVTSLAIRFTSPPHMTPHFPLTLRPGLAPTVHTPLWQSPWILGLLAGVFAGWIIFSALLSYQPSKICLGLVIALAPTHMFFPGALVHAPNLLYQYAPIFAHAIPCLCLLVGLWGLLNILKIRTATLLFLLIILGVQMGGGIAGVVLFPTNPLGAALAILVPCASLSVFMILRIMKSEPSIGLYILFGLCAFFATSLIQVATEQTLLAPTPLLLNAVLLGVYITGPLLSLAIFSLPHQFDIVEKKSPRRDRRDKDQERLEQLRIAKESFDYNNLLKVIEHERRQLAAARTRETMRGDEMRKAKEQADEANRAKGAFLAVISHEIRTPMTGIMGMVKMLVETTLTKTQHDYVRTIKESGNAMMALLNDILDFEKIESGKLQLEHLDFDLHHVITGVMALMSGHASNKGIQLNLDQEFGVPRYVIGDATRLRQVLLNLIGNGIKFTRTGSVTLKISSTASPTPDTQYMAYQIYFAIIDTGIGISAEGQKYIFNPFAQADKTITRKFGGSGLGLAISQRIIENMGSQINIKSREGDGATFFFTLTLPEGDERRIEDHAPMPAAPTPMPTATPMPPPFIFSCARNIYIDKHSN